MAFVLNVGGHRDPWWDPHGRSRRRRRVRRFATLLALALLLASLASGMRVQPARAAATVDLDQWATLDRAWQNGNLNGNNSRYPEGGIVPFRLAVEGLAAGAHQIHINYDFSAGGHKAYDFLATWNATNANGQICSGSGGAISSMCPGLGPTSTFSFPSDRFMANGLRVAGAEIYSAASRHLTMWGGTITSIGGITHAGSVDGNSTADLVVRFTSRGNAVLLAWGGHLAQSSFWDASAGGARDGASQVSGAPWHMRTLQLDGSGNKNQDRSIQPSAIVGELPPFALASPTPAPPPPGSGSGSGPAPTLGPPVAPGLIPGATPRPHLTPPPTSTADVEDPGRDGSWFTYVLLALAGLGTVALAASLPARRRPARDATRRS